MLPGEHSELTAGKKARALEPSEHVGLDGGGSGRISSGKLGVPLLKAGGHSAL